MVPVGLFYRQRTALTIIRAQVVNDRCVEGERSAGLWGLKSNGERQFCCECCRNLADVYASNTLGETHNCAAM